MVSKLRETEDLLEAVEAEKESAEAQVRYNAFFNWRELLNVVTSNITCSFSIAVQNSSLLETLVFISVFL